ncbi:hypothetical protein [Niveispirillum cyanobacteriorum]|uniref:Uncharacterized protein n=1 Tax=Niveispirillum cyanobacteriorum TaxID=1612173 RepID=A0A2K9NG08_9PROT|nr:hypothetical protein [Niveispirillum cyanobacteriorum]AUN31952.1 hypothetical protein C0V82_16105 [Niveispirillum cyanobacteriorum]GGE85478.1 hypothetical protein GCM10011317_48340 [Niveispirillum cyanobacteriorum]
MKIVQFIRNAPPYIAGELAGFPDDQALRLVREGVVKFREQDGGGGSVDGEPSGDAGGHGDGQGQLGAVGAGVGGLTGDPAGAGGTGEGGASPDPKAKAAADLLAQIDTLPWKTFAVKAAEIIGPEETRKPDILAALHALVAAQQGQA